jgi:hypothetical protein
MPEPCETCLERGRNRPGTCQVGAGWLCDDCFNGKATCQEELHGDKPGRHDERRFDLPQRGAPRKIHGGVRI